MFTNYENLSSGEVVGDPSPWNIVKDGNPSKQNKVWSLYHKLWWEID